MIRINRDERIFEFKGPDHETAADIALALMEFHKRYGERGLFALMHTILLGGAGDMDLLAGSMRRIVLTMQIAAKIQEIADYGEEGE